MNTNERTEAVERLVVKRRDHRLKALVMGAAVIVTAFIVFGIANTLIGGLVLVLAFAAVSNVVAARGVSKGIVCLEGTPVVEDDDLDELTDDLAKVDEAIVRFTKKRSPNGIVVRGQRLPSLSLEELRRLRASIVADMKTDRRRTGISVFNLDTGTGNGNGKAVRR